MPLLEELGSLLTAAGVATLNTNLFLGSARETPAGAGPYVTLIEGSGPLPRRVHNDVQAGVVLGTEGYHRPAVQVVCRATAFRDARRMARRCYRALNIRNRFVGAASFAVASLVRSGSIATATLSADHLWDSDQVIVISGANESDYNGAQTITVISAQAFTYAVAGSPSSPASGSIVAASPGTWYLEVQPAQEPFELGSDATGRPRVAFNLRILKGPS